jgi:hypothetical protein
MSGALSAGRTQYGRQAYAFVTSRVTCTTRWAAPGGFLKVLATSTSYGIFAKTNRQVLASGTKQRVTEYGLVPEPIETEVGWPEEPGIFCFPPLAAFVAGAGRLMLALLECCVTDLGGSYVMCDTDSMTIVATERGGLVPCPGGPEQFRRGPAGRHPKGAPWYFPPIFSLLNHGARPGTSSPRC